MKAEPMALLEIFGLFKDSAIPVAWGGRKRLEEGLYAFKPGRKHINLSHPSPAINQSGIFITPRKSACSCSNLRLSNVVFLVNNN